jgi:EAL domain-containing protein (putative c-di-GMP-specific phosphodiesterase class I)
LTEWVLVQACLARQGWAAAVAQPVSINVSMLSLTDVSVADRYLALARRHHVDPAQIIIEVTEDAVMKDAARSLDVLARLRLKGFGLSIDDFGTGYSSLHQLSSIPFTELKVDQSFVHGAVGDERKRAMVEASLELARKLKLTSVAEGVETRAEWDLLARLGCDLAQGWFVSQALPADEVVAWMSHWEAPPAA